MKLLLLLIPLSLASPPLIQIDGPLPPVDEVVAALQSQGALIFTGLGEEYSTALDRLNRQAPGVSITRYWSIIILIKNSSIL